MGKQQTRNTANSYDQNFDDTIRRIVDKEYSDAKSKRTASYTNYNRFRQEAFDLSKNKDFLDGSENPHTFQGGLDINSEDPFKELRASRQGGWSELGLFGSRAIAKTGREIINTAGAIGGLAPAIAGQLEDAYTGEDKTTFLQTVFNNAFIKANNEMFDKLNKEFLPVYVSDTVTNGGFTDKIFSGEFWATEGADGVGYLVSMLAPGAALKSLKVGNGIFNTAAKLTALKHGKSIATAQRALEMAGWSGQKVDSFIIPAFNTLAEAGAEARGFSDNLRANKTEALANIFNSEDFRNTKNSKLQELGQQYMSKAITQEEYESRVNNLDFEISEKMFEDQVASGMTNTFLKNVVALAGPNYIQSKILYGTNGAKNLLNQVTKKPVTQGLKRVGQAFLSEGSEEVAQTAIEHRNLEMGKKGLLGKSIVDDYNPITFGEDFIKTLGTTEGQVAGFLGGVLGSPISVIGGYIQDKKDIVRDKSARDKILLAGTSLNDIHLPIYETEIVYNYNNEPTEVRKKDENGDDILIPENVAKIKKALDFHEELSQVFDVAVEAGNTEIVNKLKEIGEQNLMMNFVGEDEMTIDAFKEHLKVTLPTENVEKSVAEENLKRQHDLLEKAKHVRKEMISFNNMVPKFIKLNNETATENQTKSFMNDLQRSFINDSVELRELEKKKSELESENADLEKFTKVEELDNPNYVEGKSHELDKKITKRTNPRLDKNNEELDKINKQIENNKKFINEEIWDNDFINKIFEDFLKEAKQIEKETSEEEVQKHDETITQINNVTSSKELEELNLDISNPIIAEKYNERLNELKTSEQAALDEELKAKENKNKELESFSNTDKHENVNVNDEVEGYVVVDKTEDSVTFKDNVTGEEIVVNVIKDPSENDSADDGYKPDNEEQDTFDSDAKFRLPNMFKGLKKSFTEFMMSPFNKKGKEMTLSLNEEGLRDNSLLANNHYKAFINGETKTLDKDLLFQWLPLSVSIDKYTSWTGYPAMNGATYSNPTDSFMFRKNIIDAIEQGYKLEDLIVTIAGQRSPSLNISTKFENNKPVKNNVLEIDSIKNQLISELELFHIDKEGQLVPVTESAVDNFSVKIKERLNTQKGAIFISIKNPLGNSVPVKLNISRVGELASPLVDIYEYILKHSQDELLLNRTLEQINNEDSKYYDEVLYNNILTKFSNEIKLLGGNESNITLEQLIETIVKSDTSNNTAIKIIQDYNGNTVLEFKEGLTYSYEDLQDKTTRDYLIDDIANNKYRNIITINYDDNKTNLDFKNKDYLEYLFNNKVLSTNLETDGYAFKQEESTIWLEPSVKIKNQKSSKPTTTSKPQQSNIEAKKADIEESKFNKEFSQVIDQLNNFFTNTIGLSIKFDGSGRRKLDNSKEVVTYEITIYQNGKAIGITGFKIVNGKIEISLTEINEELQGNGIISLLYQDINNALQQLGYGVLYSDTDFLKDTTTEQWTLDGKVLTKEEKKEITDNVDKLIELGNDGRLGKTEAVQPGKKLWQSLERKGLAEKLENGQYRFINAKYDAELKALENENNSENISEKEWNDFVDYNNVSERILNIIANKIINNESFSVKEQAIHSSNVSKIENILNNIRNSQKNSVSLQENNSDSTNVEFYDTEETLTKQIQDITEQLSKTTSKVIKSALEVKLKELNEKLNTLKLQSKPEGFVNEYQKKDTVENKEVIKTKSESQVIKDVENLTRLNNMFITTGKLPDILQKQYDKLKQEYVEEFNELPKKCEL